MRVRCWQKRRRVEAWGSPWKMPNFGEIMSAWGVELVYAVCKERVWHLRILVTWSENFSDVVKEFRGSSNMGHSDEKPMVLDSIKGLYAVHGGRVQRWGP